MRIPILKYTADQKKAIAILSEKPLTRDELLPHFPKKSKHQIAIMLRNPREMGKVFINYEGKYEVTSPPPGLKVIKGQPMPYTAPPKLEFIYEPRKFPGEKY